MTKPKRRFVVGILRFCVGWGRTSLLSVWHSCCLLGFYSRPRGWVSWFSQLPTLFVNDYWDHTFRHGFFFFLSFPSRSVITHKRNTSVNNRTFIFIYNGIYVRTTCFDLVGHPQAFQENRSKSCLVFRCLHNILKAWILYSCIDWWN